MKFSCTKENLSRGLNIVSRITTKNINLPILNNVLVSIQNKSLKLQSTNLEVFITNNIRSKIEKEGSFTVPAKLFSDYVNLLPDERIDLELIENDFIKIGCKNFKTKIKGVGASEFPLTPKVLKENVFGVSAKKLKKMIERVAFAVSPNETRPELSGVFLKFNPNKKQLIAAATDSYRLAEQKIEITESKEASSEKSIIIPAKTLQEVHRIISILSELPESSENLEMILGESQILLTCDGVEVLSRLIEGNYPEYQHIIPSGFKTNIIVNKEELSKAIKAASLFTKLNLNDIHLEFKDSEMVVSSAESQKGENSISLNIEKTGDTNKIVLNYRYLIDGLNMINTEKVKIQLNDDSTPCVIQGIDGDEDYMYLVMPIKL